MGCVGVLSVQEATNAQRDAQIVDARPKSDFDAGHIPGAIWMGWEEWCDDAPSSGESILRRQGYWGVLRHRPSDWHAERLSRLGLRSHDPILIYADGPRSRGREGRIAWMLLYLGVVSVSLLDGGWQAWVHSGGSVERESTKPAPGSFSVSIHDERRWTLAQFTDQWKTLSRPRFVDTRSAEEFSGEVPACLSFRGHIPGAVLFTFTSLFDDNGCFIDRASYAQALPPSVRHMSDPVAYCEVGVRASLFALLHEAYTDRLVSVFDGSAVDWALNSGVALQTGMTS